MRITAALIILLFVNCASEFNPVGTNPDVPLGTAFTIKPGEIASVMGEKLTVQFTAVPEDSRCPEDVECVWSGNARVGVRLIKTDAGEQAVELNTHLDPQAADYQSYRISLVALDPQPVSDGTIKDTAYRATLLIEKAGQ